MTRSMRRSSANYEIINKAVLCDAAFFTIQYDLPVTFPTISSLTIFNLINIWNGGSLIDLGNTENYIWSITGVEI